MSDTVDRSTGPTHGKSFAPTSPDPAATESSFREDARTESEGNVLALPFLNEAIEKSGVPRKQLAATVGKTEATFSKMTTTGPNAQAFGLDAFERLPLPIQIAWLKRYGRSIGLEVHELSALAVAQAIVEHFDEFSRFVRMFQIGKPRMAQATSRQEPYTGAERRRA